jgi:hypothetical protein
MFAPDSSLEEGVLSEPVSRARPRGVTSRQPGGGGHIKSLGSTPCTADWKISERRKTGEPAAQGAMSRSRSRARGRPEVTIGKTRYRAVWPPATILEAPDAVRTTGEKLRNILSQARIARETCQ